MNRDDAVTLLKKITTTCSGLSPDSVTLFQSSPADVAVGYQVFIKADLDFETERQIRTIADGFSLSVKHEEGKLVIYRRRLVAETL